MITTKLTLTADQVGILSEALVEFIHARTEPLGIEGYVAKRYDYCDSERQLEHILRVAKRVKIARGIRKLI